MSNSVKWLFVDALVLFFLAGQCAFADGLGEQNLINNSSSSIKHSIIADKPEPSVQKTDPVLAGLLQRFRQQSDELQLVADLNQYLNLLISYVDQRLLDKVHALSRNEAVELMTVLSLVADSKAIDSLISIGMRFIDEPDVVQSLLLILRELPVTAQVRAYVDAVFEKNRGKPQVVRSALLYYVAVQHDAGMRWAAYYRSPGIDPQLRFAGLNLAAILSDDDQVTRWILEELNAEPATPAYQQYYLLQGLSANITEEEFNHLLPGFNISSVVVKEFQRLRDFNNATGDQKYKLAGFMLVSPHMDQQQEALRYYLENRQIMDVWPQLGVSKRLTAIRLANTHGWALLPVAGQEIPVAKDPGRSIVYIAVGLLLFVLLVMGLRSFRRT